MQRELGVCGRWCASHRANLVAGMGLARLTKLPPPKERRAKYTYAADAHEALVSSANKLCAVLQTTHFKNLMRQEQDEHDFDITEFTTVRLGFCVYYYYTLMSHFAAKCRPVAQQFVFLAFSRTALSADCKSLANKRVRRCADARTERSPMPDCYVCTAGRAHGIGNKGCFMRIFIAVRCRVCVHI